MKYEEFFSGEREERGADGGERREGGIVLRVFVL